MQVKFIGNPADSSDNRGFIVWAGERFDLNVPRDLPEGKAFAKIPSNSHFEVVAEPHTGVVDPEWDFDPGKAYDKDDLIAIAEARGVKIDKRWSVVRLAEAIKTGE